MPDAGHGAARARAAGALRRFSEQLSLPVATTFHGKGTFPDDHPNALGAVGFMRRDYVNFGFEEADVIISVGYELQEFDPARINPGRDKRILHLSRFPAEVDASYDVEVGVQADISATLDALTAATTRRWEPGASGEKIAHCWRANWRAARPMTVSRSNPSGWYLIRGAPWGAQTSFWPTPGR